MSPYLAIFRTRLSMLVQYRSAAIAGIGTQLFWGFIKVMVLTAFYASAQTPPPISLSQAIAFVWLGQALLTMLPWKVDREIEVLIKSGNVAYELVRPIDLYWHWFAQGFALLNILSLMRGSVLFLIAGLFFGLSAPVSLSAGCLFTLSLVCASLLSTSIITLVVISLFWTLSGEGILRLLPQIVIVLTGVLVPLPLYPEWMQPFLNWQPFRGITDIPVRLYTGIIPASEGFNYLAFQLGWTAVLIWAGRGFMQRAVKHVVIQGG